jgi:uncharacterized protein involved in exopolysaccharide biosynthesis
MSDLYLQEYTKSSSSLRNFVLFFFKRRKIIFYAFVAIVAIVTLTTFLMPPVYQTSTKILVEHEGGSEKSMLFRLNLPLGTEGYDWVKSEIEILTSYPVISKVLHDLGSDDLKPGSQYNDLMFEKAVKKFQKRLHAENARNSNVIEVGYESQNAQSAVATVNRLVETYIEYRSKIYQETGTYKFFDEQIRVADEKLRDLETRLYSYKDEAEILSPEKQSEILLTKLADYERSLTAVQTKRIGKEAKLAVITDQLQKNAIVDIPATDVSDSPSHEKYIAKLKGELLDMEIQRDQLLQRFKPTYEEIVELEKRITATRKIIRYETQQIINQERTAIRALRAEEQALQNALDKINLDIKAFAKKEFEFNQLNRGIDDNQEVYSMLLKQREDARIALAKLQQGVQVKIISPAVLPQKPAKPRKRLNIVLGVLLGLMTGLGLAYFIESNDHTIRTAEELNKYTSLTVLGSVRDLKRLGQGKPRDNHIRHLQTR